MNRDYMETLLEVFEEVLADENDFNRAKILSHGLLDYFQRESFAVILAALHLTAMAMIDYVETECRSNKFFN